MYVTLWHERQMKEERLIYAPTLKTFHVTERILKNYKFTITQPFITDFVVGRFNPLICFCQFLSSPRVFHVSRNVVLETASNVSTALVI
jgi:hypothetical protein